VTNETVGMMMVASALGLTGKVILPELATDAAVASVRWAGLEPVFCEVDPLTLQIDVNAIGALIEDDVSAIMGMHAFGGVCDVNALEKLAAAKGVKLYFDASHAFGCKINGNHVANFGMAEIFSFHQDNILNATEGGCICTNDDQLAAQLRTMRSSAGAGKPVEVAKTVNGRMTEAQCAVALMNLEDYAANQQHNEGLFRLYESKLSQVPGVSLVRPFGVSHSNLQSVVSHYDKTEFGLSAQLLAELLVQEGAQVMSLTESRNNPATCVALPLGKQVSEKVAETICDLVGRAHSHAHEIVAARSR
jgi:dTDP-4-amino-4,6-dideoxygalactose transaminase